VVSNKSVVFWDVMQHINVSEEPITAVVMAEEQK
jgi:hypothetical protein